MLNREQYEVVETYCVEQSIRKNFKISYGLKHKVDIFHLIELIESLQPSDTVSLAFNLDFVHMFSFDMHKFVKLFKHISDLVVALSIGSKKLAI